MNPANGCEVNTRHRQRQLRPLRRRLRLRPGVRLGRCATTCGAGTTNCSGARASTLATDPAQLRRLPHRVRPAQRDRQHLRLGAPACVGGCDAGFADCDGAAANGCETNVRGADVNSTAAPAASRCRFANARRDLRGGRPARWAPAPRASPTATATRPTAARPTSPPTTPTADVAGAPAPPVRCARRASARRRAGRAPPTARATASAPPPTRPTLLRMRTPALCALANVSVNACAGGACAWAAATRASPTATARRPTAARPPSAAATRTTAAAAASSCRFANAAATCATGACALGACTAGFADCDGDSTNGCEVNTDTDNANCGACGGRPARGGPGVRAGGCCSA